MSCDPRADHLPWQMIPRRAATHPCPAPDADSSTLSHSIGSRLSLNPANDDPNPGNLWPIYPSRPDVSRLHLLRIAVSAASGGAALYALRCMG